MIVYLIRHGHAEEREAFKGRDLDRPLTEKGKVRAKRAFTRFFNIYDKPAAVLTSAAVRCVETASIISEICGVKYDIRERLNPGAKIKDYLETVSDWRHASPLAVVGHEPDLSDVISFITGGKALRLELKKGSIAHIDDSVLVNLIQQKALL